VIGVQVESVWAYGVDKIIITLIVLYAMNIFVITVS